MMIVFNQSGVLFQSSNVRFPIYLSSSLGSLAYFPVRQFPKSSFLVCCYILTSRDFLINSPLPWESSELRPSFREFWLLH